MELIDQFIQEPLAAIRQKIKDLEDKIKEKINTLESLRKKVARRQEFAAGKLLTNGRRFITCGYPGFDGVNQKGRGFSNKV